MNVRLFLVTLIVPLFTAIAVQGAVEPKSAPREKGVVDFTGAAEWFQKGLELNRAGDYREAAEAFRKVIAITPGDAAAWFNLGTASAFLGNYEEAATSLKQTVRLNPEFLPAYGNLGAICYRLGRFREAIEAYGQVLRLKPDDTNARFNRGMAYYAMGDKDSAWKEYEMLKPLDGELAAKLLEAITR